MPDENSVVSLPWHKWRLEDYRVFRDSLTNEQMGALFFAIMNTAETGDVIDVPGEIRVAYRLCVQQVLAARTAYIHRCEVNAQNGKKGGEQKAANTKAKEAEQATFTPPTKTEFRNMAKHYKSGEEAVFDAYELDQFYDELTTANWAIGGVKIESQDALDAAFFARFHPYSPWRNTTTWTYFKNVFQLSGGDLDIWDRFEDCYNREQRHWTVDGTTYDKPADAVQAILANASKA